ncbi:N-acyl homoserine lactonase family protein [Geomicrobium sp. JCM 19038]|uniref:N-acyl homoserine lactonase family protein n=1 Tax=Geomicrobium sp. JCM 19038 TaxID=1460635 RepID=UPI00045F3D16|nr:N-acyl homoserine lactonase family protein [Geomicrobium sp. JCM 19038]GAK08272.1 AttM/AiiB protein [Geomicrobium sp. JCM 19038]
MNVHIMHTGKVQIDRALALKEKGWHPAPYTGWLRSSKKIWVPVSTYLIEHQKGLLLLDTGWHEAIRTNQRKHLGTLAHSMFKGVLPEGESIRELLQTRGYRAEDLDYVLLSHLDADHVSGLGHVQDASSILVSTEEWTVANRGMRYNKTMWKGASLITFDFEESGLGPVGRSYDLFGDGSVTLIHTPGHSRGMFSVLLKTSRASMLLVNDTGYCPQSWEELIVPGITVDDLQAKQSLRWVQQQASEVDYVFANHDTTIKPMTITL